VEIFLCLIECDFSCFPNCLWPKIGALESGQVRFPGLVRLRITSDQSNDHIRFQRKNVHFPTAWLNKTGRWQSKLKSVIALLKPLYYVHKTDL